MLFVGAAPPRIPRLYIKVFLSRSFQRRAYGHKYCKLRARLTRANRSLVLRDSLILLPNVEWEAIPLIRVTRTVPKGIYENDRGLASFFFIRSRARPCPFHGNFTNRNDRKRVCAVGDRPIGFLFPALPIPMENDMTRYAGVGRVTRLVEKRLFVRFVVKPQRRQHCVFATPYFRALTNLFRMHVGDMASDGKTASP